MSSIFIIAIGIDRTPSLKCKFIIGFSCVATLVTSYLIVSEQGVNAHLENALVKCFQLHIWDIVETCCSLAWACRRLCCPSPADASSSSKRQTATLGWPSPAWRGCGWAVAPAQEDNAVKGRLCWVWRWCLVLGTQSSGNEDRIIWILLP